MRESTVQKVERIQNLAGLGHKEEAAAELQGIQEEFLEVAAEQGVVFNTRFTAKMLLGWMREGIPAGVRLGMVTPYPDGTLGLAFIKESEDAVEEGQEQGDDQPQHSGIEEVGETNGPSGGDSNEGSGEKQEEAPQEEVGPAPKAKVH